MSASPPPRDEDDNSPEVDHEILQDDSGDIVAGLAQPLRAMASSSSVIDLTLSDDDDENDDMQMSDPITLSKPTVRIKSETDSSEQPLELQSLRPDDQHGSLDFQEKNPDFLKALEIVDADLGDGDDQMNTAFLNWSNSETFGTAESFGPGNEVNLGTTSDAHDGLTDPIPDEPNESDIESEQAPLAFSDIKKDYEKRKARGETDLIDDIKFGKAKRQEEQRLEHSERQRKDAEQPAPEEGLDLFVSEGERTNSPEPMSDEDQFGYTSLKTGNYRSPYVRSNVDSDDDSILQGPRPTPNKRRGRTPGTKQPRKADSKKVKKSSTAKVRKSRAKKKKPQLTASVANLLTHDIVQEAQANQQLSAGPEFKGRNRRTALTEFLVSMPEDQRDLHTDDKKAIDNAVKQFKNCRLDGLGGWKVRDMVSSLHNHQVIGAGYMRKRERTRTAPFGGMLSDEMGFGKTIMTIAAILDGKSDAKPTRKTTLIVATPALTTQWIQEIRKHAGKALGSVIIYRSGARVISTDTADMLASMDVVITTYSEVLRSWPKNEPPIDIVTQEGKARWWNDQLAQYRGDLHKVTWHRIVLDEAQAIKNRHSRTFEAVLGLEGKLRWALSGTPVQNTLDEFFPYFAFLRMPETGDFTLWKRNFCKKGSDLAARRLTHIVNCFMLRRTHASRLFGAPCVKLPNITVTSIPVTFSPLEAAVYRIVKARFTERVKGIYRSGQTDRSYHVLFTLILRLRQMTAHILLIQKTLQDLLEPDDLENLWKLCRRARQERKNDEATMQTIAGLELALKNVGPNDASREPGVKRFMQAMQADGQWGKIMERTACKLCKKFPVHPQSTACFHIYCKDCLEDLIMEAKVKGFAGPVCVECGVEITQYEACKALDEPNQSQNGANSQPLSNSSSSGDEEHLDWYTLSGPMSHSAKTQAAARQIATWFDEDSTSKIIVFTQFRGIIKVMTRVCQENGWDSVPFHGAMSFDSRDKSIHKFTVDPDCRILLAGMKAGGVGLNLTAANRCIIIDLWWNNAVEQQAFCRMFRIGQERDVQVVRFTVTDSIDDAIVSLQERKINAIEPVLDPHGLTGRNLSVQDMIKLFAMDFERDVNGEVIAGGEDEPFIIPDDPYYQRAMEMVDDD